MSAPSVTRTANAQEKPAEREEGLRATPRGLTCHQDWREGDREHVHIIGENITLDVSYPVKGTLLLLSEQVRYYMQAVLMKYYKYCLYTNNYFDNSLDN